MDYLQDWFHRLVRAWRKRSLAEFAALCWHNLKLLASGRLSGQRYVHDRSFDRMFNVDTAGTEEIADLTTPGGLAREHGRRYEAASPEMFAQLLQHVPSLQLDRFTFIDIGSGKGRALFLAARYPFRKIIGVEFAKELHDVAVRNIGTYTDPQRKCAFIESHCADATSYDMPAGPVFCFMNNPFDETLMRPFCDKLTRDLAKRADPFLLVYMHANHGGVFTKDPRWATHANGIVGERAPFVILTWKANPL